MFVALHGMGDGRAINHSPADPSLNNIYLCSAPKGKFKAFLFTSY